MARTSRTRRRRSKSYRHGMFLLSAETVLLRSSIRNGTSTILHALELDVSWRSSLPQLCFCNSRMSRHHCFCRGNVTRSLFLLLNRCRFSRPTLCSRPPSAFILLPCFVNVSHDDLCMSRHHCRCCGNVYCTKCTAYVLPLNPETAMVSAPFTRSADAGYAKTFLIRRIAKSQTSG